MNTAYRLLLVAFSLSPLALRAQTSSVEPRKEEAVLLPAFTIQSESESGYAATNSISATKVATELKKMPVSIDIITEQLFKDYGLTEVYDIVGLSSGVQSTQRAATGNLESYTIRGFTTFFSARNGNTNLRSYDSANVSRVEVVTVLTQAADGAGPTFEEFYKVRRRTSTEGSAEGCKQQMYDGRSLKSGNSNL
jgi:outer membrane receptor protein involved in Fe transport